MGDVVLERGGTDVSAVEAELRKFNWGALLLGWVWAFGHRLWLWGILGLIPLVGLVVQIGQGFQGNRMAWERGGYASAEELRRKERRWAWASLWVYLATFLLFFGIGLLGGSSEA